MPRIARQLSDGGYYHLVTRGNNRAAVFHDAVDFQRYGQLLMQYLREYHLALYHYCLMTNHVHLIVQIDVGTDLQSAMHGLNLSYALAYKKRYPHIGHFWQDRFKSIPIVKDSHLLQCGAYIELNPVRAGLARLPHEYAWSSYQAYAYGRYDPLIQYDPLYLDLAPSVVERQACYREFVEAQLQVPDPNDLLDGAAALLTDSSQQLAASLRSRPRGRPLKLST